MDYSLPGSSVLGILQAKILKWIAIPYSRGLLNPGIEPGSPALQAHSLPSESLGEIPVYELDHPNKLVSQWGDTWNAISIKIPNLSCQLMVDNFFFSVGRNSAHTLFFPL